MPLRSLTLSDQPAAYPLLMQTPSALAASRSTLTSLRGLILADFPGGRRSFPAPGAADSPAQRDLARHVGHALQAARWGITI